MDANIFSRSCRIHVVPLTVSKEKRVGVFSGNESHPPLMRQAELGECPMLKKLMTMVMALSVVTGVTITSTTQAEARHGRGSGFGIGLATGIIGLGILGAAANARGYPYRSYSHYDDGPECYRGRRECHWSGRRCFENRWGDTVCRGGRYICERPLICE
jgi:hypothetical protein